jgi:hypothetical protein
LIGSTEHWCFCLTSFNPKFENVIEFDLFYNIQINFNIKTLIQKVCGKFEFLSKNCSAKKEYFFYLLYRQKACGKFEFLLNKCSAKKVYFFILLYRRYASGTLWKVKILVKQLFVKKDVFFFPIVQALSRQFLKS